MVNLHECKVVQFRDGDSFDVSPLDLPSVSVHCRLVITDTPEYPWTENQKRASRPYEIAQYNWGLKAAARTKELIEASGTIQVDFLGDERAAVVEYSSRRARSLVLAYLSDGSCLNEILISEGLAAVFLENDGITPYRDIQKCPEDLQLRLLRAEAEAIRNGLGIWSDANCLRPQVFRNGYFKSNKP